MSKPAPIKISPLLSLMSLPIYFPMICSFGTEIVFNPFSLSFFAITTLSFSPTPNIFLVVLASIRS